ncbi:MAG TPA: hypothetical protein VFD58_00765 [Blastocatellia bacterium]|nr:hypothetical protein [Blastocatellia bacterium]
MEDSTRDIVVGLLQQIIARQERFEAGMGALGEGLQQANAGLTALERRQQTEEIILTRLNDTRPLEGQSEILRRLDRIDRKLAIIEKSIGEMAGRDLELRSRVGFLESQLEQPETQ